MEEYLQGLLITLVLMLVLFNPVTVLTVIRLCKRTGKRFGRSLMFAPH